MSGVAMGICVDESYNEDVQLAIKLQKREERKLKKMMKAKSMKSGKSIKSGKTMKTEPTAKPKSSESPSSGSSDTKSGSSGSKSGSKKKNYLEQQDGFYTEEYRNESAEEMPYVLCDLDGHVVEMLIDSGASSSAISSIMVKHLSLEHKLSRHVHGKVSGVGSAQLAGVLENVACSMHQIDFRLFFMVIESNVPFVIMGLDQMRRFKCVIDIGDSAVRFGGLDGIRIPFISSSPPSKEEAPPPKEDFVKSVCKSQSSSSASSLSSVSSSLPSPPQQRQPQHDSSTSRRHSAHDILIDNISISATTLISASTAGQETGTQTSEHSREKIAV